MSENCNCQCPKKKNINPIFSEISSYPDLLVDSMEEGWIGSFVHEFLVKNNCFILELIYPVGQDIYDHSAIELLWRQKIQEETKEYSDLSLLMKELSEDIQKEFLRDINKFFQEEVLFLRYNSQYQLEKVNY